MKFLVISFFYPPAKAVASERWFRFSKELRNQGHEVTVWTGPWKSDALGVVQIHDPFSEDASTLESTAQNPSKTPNTIRLLLQKLSIGFLLIDGKWFWSFKVFLKIVFFGKIKNEYDYLIVSGGPWSSIVWTSLAARLRGIPLIVDFRDPWSVEETFRYNKTTLGRWYNSTLEGWVVRNAKKVLSVSSGILNQLRLDAEAQIQNPDRKFLALESGYDGTLDWRRDDFNSLERQERLILYAGSVTVYHGNKTFLDSARHSIPPKMKLVFMGPDYAGILKDYPFCTHHSQVTSQEAEAIIRQTGVVLFTVSQAKANIAVGGKLMTYLKCGRPILYFGSPQSPAAQIIQKNDLGWVVDSDKPELLAPVLKEIQSHFESGKPFHFNPHLAGLEQYSAKNIIQRLIESLR